MGGPASGGPWRCSVPGNALEALRHQTGVEWTLPATRASGRVHEMPVGPVWQAATGGVKGTRRVTAKAARPVTP